MTDAYIIESAGDTAGIVVVEERGLRFYASTAGYFVLDGRTFANVAAVHHAIKQLQREDRAGQRRGHGFQPAA